MALFLAGVDCRHACAGGLRHAASCRLGAHVENHGSHDAGWLLFRPLRMGAEPVVFTGVANRWRGLPDARPQNAIALRRWLGVALGGDLAVCGVVGHCASCPVSSGENWGIQHGFHWIPIARCNTRISDRRIRLAVLPTVWGDPT